MIQLTLWLFNDLGQLQLFSQLREMQFFTKDSTQKSAQSRKHTQDVHILAEHNQLGVITGTQYNAYGMLPTIMIT